nr:hypothetical protein [Corynebacterium phoceense]
MGVSAYSTRGGELGVDLADHEPIVRELAQLPGVCTVRDLAPAASRSSL